MNIWNAKSSSGTHSLTIEVEWNNECDIEYPPLEQIEISIPLHDQPQIEQLENSTLKTKDDGYCWVIESLSEEDPSSVIKLTTTTPEQSLFPIKIDLHQNFNLLGMEVLEATDVSSGETLSHKYEANVHLDGELNRND